MRGRETAAIGETLLLDFRLDEDAPFVGRHVADLGLPPGCLLVTVQRGAHSEVPTRHTVLQAGDFVTAVVAPSATGAIEILRHGFERH